MSTVTTPETQSTMSTNSSGIFVFPNNPNLLKKNIILCLLFCVFTVISIPITLRAKLAIHIKVILLNVLASNFISFFVTTVFSILMFLNHLLNIDSCHVYVFILLYNNLMTHVSTFFICLNNFCSIKFPLRYKQLLVGKTLLILLLATWIGGAVVSFSFLVGGSLKGASCAALAYLPRYGLIGHSILTLTLDTCGHVLNILVCQMASTNNASREREDNENREGRHELNKTSDALVDVTGVSANRSVLFMQRTQPLDNRQVTHTSPQPMRNTPAPVSGGNNARKVLFSENIAEEVVLSCLRPYQRSHRIEPQPQVRTERPSDQQNRQILPTGNTDRANTQIRPSIIIQTLATSSDTGADTPRNKLRNTLKTLTILSLWSFTLKIPLAVYVFYVGVFVEDRVEATSNIIYITVTTCYVIGLMGDPFLFAWRLISWRDVIARVRHAFKRN